MTPRIKESQNPAKLVRSGTFAIKRKKWAKAKRKFEAALDNENMQQSAIVWANYGIALTNLKLLKEAKDAFTRATNLSNKSELWIKKESLSPNLRIIEKLKEALRKL